MTERHPTDETPRLTPEEELGVVRVSEADRKLHEVLRSKLWHRHANLAANPARTDEEDHEMRGLAADLGDPLCDVTPRSQD